MAEDIHLGTGEYDPEQYWNARARYSKNNCLRAVGAFVVTDDENRSMDRIQRHLMKSALNFICNHMDLRGKRVLEYGCGAGRWISFFQKHLCTWSGVDISTDMLTIARNNHPSTDIKKIDGTRVPHQGNTFDLVYAVTVIHHNPYDNQEKIVSEMVRILRNGGYLILYEDLGTAGGFNVFPRPKSAWFALAKRHGCIPVWHQGARYWILRDAAAAAKGKLRQVMERSRLLRRLQNYSQWYLYSRLVPFLQKRGLLEIATKHFRQDNTHTPDATGSDEIHNNPDQSWLWRKLIGRIDCIIDPYLLQFLPPKHHTAAIMVFWKKE